MANNFSSQKMVETSKMDIILLTGTFSDNASGLFANTVIVGSQLRGALANDTNNSVTVAMGGYPRSYYDYTVARIIYDVNIPGGYLQIAFDGANSGSTIWTCKGAFDMNFQMNMGVIKNTANGANGNIIFSTIGASTGNNSYSVIIELHKQGSTWDFGQVAKASDFNFGASGIKP